MSLPNGPKTALWLQNIQLMSNPLKRLDKLNEEYGPVFTGAFGEQAVFVSNPQGLKDMFANSQEIEAPGDLNKTAAPVVGFNGLLLLEKSRHRHRRKLIMPAMHSRNIQAYGHRICEITRRTFAAQRQGETLIATEVLEDICLEVILDVVFGLTEGSRYQAFNQLLPPLLHLITDSRFEPLLSLPFFQRDLGKWTPWQRFCVLRQQFDDLLEAEIKDRRQQQTLSGTDVLSELMTAEDETGQRLSDRDLRDLLPSLVFAGQDASATSSAWALYWVHHLPEVKERLLQELSSITDLNDVNAPMQIARLPYLSAVCNEVLRIYPTQMLTFPRRVMSTTTVSGYQLPPGTVLIGNIYQAHQQPDLYPNPKQFRPERFLERKFSAYEFVPFGGGSRVCIGAALAMFEMKLTLATTLLHYQMDLADDEPEFPKRQGILFPPARGVRFQIQKVRTQTPNAVLAN